jgi:hypothetical protein
MLRVEIFTDDLVQVTEVAEEAPKEVALISKFNEADGIEAMRCENASKQTLETYLKFGRQFTVISSQQSLWLGPHLFHAGLQQSGRRGGLDPRSTLLSHLEIVP